MGPDEEAPPGPNSKKDDVTQDNEIEDGLNDLGVNCRLVQGVQTGHVAIRTKNSTPSAREVIHEKHDIAPRLSANGTSANGSSAIPTIGGELGTSLFAPSFAAAAPDLEAAVSVQAPVKQGEVVCTRKNRAPTSAPPPARPFKQSPAHDEHHETSATVILSPKETYDHIVAAGVAKTKLTLAKQVTQGVLAGFYISFSFMLCMTVGGQIDTIQHEHPGIYNFILGAVGFPLGLTVIMVAGADLFTSSCMYMITAWIEGRVAFYYVIKNWFISWWSNLAGCLIMAQLVVWAGIFAPPKNSFPIYLAHKKTSATFGATVVKGILCNWLVNLAVWMANSARDVTGKAVGVYLPVSAFVTLGTEHVVANQFQLSVSKMLGSGISLRTIIGSNLVPATIGNIIGGAFFVGTLYAGVYGTLYDRMWLRFVQMYIWAVPRRIRNRNTAICKAVQDTVYGWVDWDAITAPPGPLPPVPAPNTVLPRVSTSGPSGLARAVSSALAQTPRRLATAVVAATRNPPMTPFERQRTEHGLGSDVV